MKTEIYDEIFKCMVRYENIPTELIMHLGSDFDEFVLQTNRPSEQCSSIHSDYLTEFTQYNLCHWVVITDEFDEPKFKDEQDQYNYIFNCIKGALNLAKCGVVVVLQENWKDEFQYSILYIAARLFDLYPNDVVTVKSCGKDNKYIFCINRKEEE